MQIVSLTVGPMEVNCYLVWENPQEAVVIDPGAQHDKIIEALEERKLIPKSILLTHGHFDHIGAVAELKRKYHTEVIIGAEDEEMLDDPLKNAASLAGIQLPSVSATRVVSEGDLIVCGGLTFEVLHTPGHSKGSVVYSCGNALFSGDTLFAGSMGRTDFYGGDARKITQSLQRLACLKGDYRVFPGHGPETTLERERFANPFLGADYDSLS